MTQLRSAAIALVAILALAACGTTQDAADEGSASAGGGPITLTDDIGRTVSLDGPAQRVVVTEWQQTEDVLTLGVTPVGVSDAAGYRTWDTAEELPTSVAEVGERGEPNLEAIFALNPDLVIVEAESETQTVKLLQQRGIDVLVTTGSDTADPVAKMRTTISTIATALGREDEAKEAIADFDTALTEGAREIAAANPDNRRFLYFDAYVEGANLSIRPFGTGSYVGDIGEKLGLQNVWTGAVDPAYGLGNTDIEGLANVGDARLLYNDTESSEFLPALQRNAIWTNLQPVKAGNVTPFPKGIWTFGGPKSGEQLIDAYVAAMKS